MPHLVLYLEPGCDVWLNLKSLWNAWGRHQVLEPGRLQARQAGPLLFAAKYLVISLTAVPWKADRCQRRLYILGKHWAILRGWCALVLSCCVQQSLWKSNELSLGPTRMQAEITDQVLSVYTENVNWWRIPKLGALKGWKKYSKVQ